MKPIPSIQLAEEFNAPIALNELVQTAIDSNASDVHLQKTDDLTEVKFRLDGVLVPFKQYHGEIAERILGRIKYLARLKSYQSSLPQEGRIEDTAIPGSHELRVSSYPTVNGEKIVIRLFHHQESPTLDALGFPRSTVGELEVVLQKTSGLLLLTGPAGSGKTTTIYSCLRHLCEYGGRHIITVEDPVERILPGVMQTEVNEALDLTFAEASRHLLRQDPEILVIGEIRDEETASIALRGALTGHLVISTLHAGSCTGVYDRMRSLSTDLSALNASLEMIINQRLIRRLCVDCRGTGCPSCLDTGYRGRVPLVESFRVTKQNRERIIKEGRHGINPGSTLEQQAAGLVEAGVTNKSEIRRVLGL